MTSSNVTAQPLQGEAKEVFEANLHSQRARLDGMFAWLMMAQWAFAILVAVLYSPKGWEGKTSVINIHVPLAIFMGAGLAIFPFMMARRKPGSTATRQVIAVTQMLWSALLIHLSGGRIETHFHVFGSLAWLAFYLDWKILLTATVVVATEHLMRGIFYPESVYGITNPEWWRFLEHAFWVIFEDVILVWACINGLKSLQDFARREVEVQNKSAALEMAMKELRGSMGKA